MCLKGIDDLFLASVKIARVPTVLSVALHRPNHGVIDKLAQASFPKKIETEKAGNGACPKNSHHYPYTGYLSPEKKHRPQKDNSERDPFGLVGKEGKTHNDATEEDIPRRCLVSIELFNEKNPTQAEDKGEPMVGYIKG